MVVELAEMRVIAQLTVVSTGETVELSELKRTDETWQN